MTADAYVELVESVVKKFCDHKSICSITIDSARACKKAREAYENKCHGMISINDQAHIGNLLIKDICSLPWIKEVTDTASNINMTVHHFSKLKLRFA